MNNYRYVIVGSSAGGFSAAREIRKFDSSNELLMLSDEPYPAYSRPLIAKHISEGRDITAMQLVAPGFYDSHGIELRLSSHAVRIDVSDRVLHLHDGAAVEWEHLLLAIGAEPILPPIPGRERQGVHTFTTYDDAIAISERLPGVRHAVIVGGGFVGLSAADALSKRGVGVTIVEMQSRLLSAMLDECASRVAEEATVAAGVRVATSRRVVSVNGDHPQSHSVSSVTLDDGSRIQCELVILAVGVKPRTRLAEGIAAVRRGILVDRSMKTTAENIFACGDACETYDFARDCDAVLAIWPSAIAGGAVAGAAMTGQQTTYQGGTTLNALPYFGLSVGSAGVVEHDPSMHEILVESGPRHYRKVVLRDGIIVGLVFVGDTSKCGLLYTLMKHRVNVRECRDSLVSDDFGLLSLPDHLWKDAITAKS
jgi:NAD(P)H-nitrite reductase large subunit